MLRRATGRVVQNAQENCRAGTRQTGI